MYLVGIDLGGTEIKGGLFTVGGDLLHKLRKRTPVSEGFEGISDAIAGLIEELIKMGEVNKKDVRAVGVGIPGICDEEGIVYTAVNLFWENVPLGHQIAELTDLPIYVENDGTVAAIGEATQGSMKGVNNGVFITLGTGVGGGIIVKGEPYSGSHGLGSELGHMIIGENYYNCNCGSNGCLETFASATALIKYAQKLFQDENLNSSMLDKLNGDLTKLDAKIIFDAAKEGDELATKAVDRFIKALSIGIANIINLLDPEVIAIGGGVSKAGDYLINLINKEIGKYIFYKKDPLRCQIVLAELENDAGIIGAAMLGKNRH